MSSQLPVVVIGAGPVGLAAAAHLAERGLPFLVLEAGNRPGAAARGWGHVRTFTPWTWIVDAAAERLLSAVGWSRPTTGAPPTGDELAEHYLEPLADLLGERVRTGHRVIAVAREGADKGSSVGREKRPFVVRVSTPDGALEELHARAVIDASGTWGRPAPLGASGLPALGEEAARASGAVVGPLPDVLGLERARFAGRRTVVVGAGHSAAGTLLDLGRLATEVAGTEVVWVVRGTDLGRVYGGGAADELPERGRLGTDLRSLVASGVVELVTGFATAAVEVSGEVVALVAPDGARVEGHTVVAATGFRPDLSLLSEVRLDLDPGLDAPRQLAPLIDPAYHSCGTVPPHGHRDLAQPEPGLYLVGMKSYGRAPTFLIPTGNEQVRSVVAALAGDVAAADEVQLALPETGVCSVGPTGEDTAAAGGCCGSDPVAPAQAHRNRPAGVAAQGFPTGLPGGGRVAALALLDAPAGRGCCA